MEVIANPQNQPTRLVGLCAQLLEAELKPRGAASLPQHHTAGKVGTSVMSELWLGAELASCRWGVQKGVGAWPGRLGLPGVCLFRHSLVWLRGRLRGSQGCGWRVLLAIAGIEQQPLSSPRGPVWRDAPEGPG